MEQGKIRKEKKRKEKKRKRKETKRKEREENKENKAYIENPGRWRSRQGQRKSCDQ